MTDSHRLSEVTSKGKPVALMRALDEEQLALGRDPEFWKMIEARRKEKTITHEELMARLAKRDRLAKKIRKAA